MIPGSIKVRDFHQLPQAESMDQNYISDTRLQSHSRVQTGVVEDFCSAFLASKLAAYRVRRWVPSFEICTRDSSV